MVTTMISSRLCQREISTLCSRLRVTSLAATTITSINTHVVTMVTLSLKNPCCHRINSSELRCMVLPRGHRHIGQPDDDKTRDDETEQTQQQPFPVRTGDQIESAQHDGGAQQHAAAEPQRRLPSRYAFQHRPPQAPEEQRAQQQARQQDQRQLQQLIHLHLSRCLVCPDPNVLPYP